MTRRDQLLEDARKDDEAAEEASERNPMFAEYLERRAAWRRRLARDEETWERSQAKN